MLWGLQTMQGMIPTEAQGGLAPREVAGRHYTITRTKDEENLHGQVTDTRGATGSTGLPRCAHTHAVGHSDGHVECGKKDEAIPGGSQSPTVQQDEG